RPQWPRAKGAAKRVRVPLSALAHGRSGDKGDTCNIGVIARAPEIYPWLRRALTANLVKRRFKGICLGRVERHEVPNLWALTFLLHESLGGGGTVSLRLDAQGKTLSHALLAMVVRAPKRLLEIAARGDRVNRAFIGNEPKPTRPSSVMVERRVAQRRRAGDAAKPAATPASKTASASASKAAPKPAARKTARKRG